jgi:6-phosphogluconate dehydrogenase
MVVSIRSMFSWADFPEIDISSLNVYEYQLHRNRLWARATDAETTPMRNPEYYKYELDLPEIAEVWHRGCVIISRLLDLTAIALLNDPDLKNYVGRVSDSGKGRWRIAAAVDEGVPVSVISAALFGRFEGQQGRPTVHADDFGPADAASRPGRGKQPEPA